MAATSLSAAARNAACNAIVDLVDVGIGDGVIEIRSGTQPANPSVPPPDGALLAEVSMAAVAFGAASNGQASALGTPLTDPNNANATGQASWFRVRDGDGNGVIDGDITTTAVGTGNMLLNSTDLVAGGPVQITSFTFTVPVSQ